jgi:hypothetical protein
MYQGRPNDCCDVRGDYEAVFLIDDRTDGRNRMRIEPVILTSEGRRYCNFSVFLMDENLFGFSDLPTPLIRNLLVEIA